MCEWIIWFAKRVNIYHSPTYFLWSDMTVDRFALLIKRMFTCAHVCDHISLACTWIPLPFTRYRSTAASGLALTSGNGSNSLYNCRVIISFNHLLLFCHKLYAHIVHREHWLQSCRGHAGQTGTYLLLLWDEQSLTTFAVQAEWPRSAWPRMAAVSREIGTMNASDWSNSLCVHTHCVHVYEYFMSFCIRQTIFKIPIVQRFIYSFVRYSAVFAIRQFLFNGRHAFFGKYLCCYASRSQK